VAVNLTNNKSAVGLGQLARASDELYMCGGHGVAIKMLHLFGDKLWSHEPSLVQQIPLVRTKALSGEDFPALGSETERKKAANPAAPAPVTFASVTQTEELETGTAALSLENQETPESDDDVEDEASPELILKNAFLAALKNNGKKLPLPLLTSNFYRLYVVTEAPDQIDLKKTRYKKLSNFLAEMVDQGFIVVREESKGVDKSCKAVCGKLLPQMFC